MEEKVRYKIYSEYLKSKYGEKVYKLPVNLPVTCPNKINGMGGCTFCSEEGTGFEAMPSQKSVTEQLRSSSLGISLNLRISIKKLCFGLWFFT